MTGGSATGGTATGGAGIGGANAGGGATGGTATGGNATGGAGIGGVSAGGSTTGGTAMGGGATGGTNTGGSATGGAASTCIGSPVSSLPAMGTACNTVAESQCDASGNRCICERGMWYCNDTCATAQPSIPTPSSACTRGMTCTYGSVGCACVNLQWMCVGMSQCPPAASTPTSGQACDGLTGVVCDYPHTTPAFHMACVCSINADAGSGSSWTCVQSAYCPATQPPYDLAGSCPGTAMCTYGNTHCLCMQNSTPWVCI